MFGLFDHLFCGHLGDKECSVKIDTQYPREFLMCNVKEVPIGHNACVVDEHIDIFEALKGNAQKVSNIERLGDVTVVKVNGSSLGMDIFGAALAGVFVDIRNNNVCTLKSEAFGDGFADSVCTPGDEGGFTFEFFGHVIVLPLYRDFR